MVWPRYCGRKPNRITWPRPNETSTRALTNATLPYVLSIANQGWHAAAEADSALSRGLNVWNGQIVNPRVSEALGMQAAG